LKNDCRQLHRLLADRGDDLDPALVLGHIRLVAHVEEVGRAAVQHHDRADVLTADADLAVPPNDPPVVRRIREIRWRRALTGPHRK
jgi:hypothetical protein